MTTSILNRPALFGIAQGYMPLRGPKVLCYDLDLTAGATTFDITEEIMADQIEFIQSMHVDNSANNTNLIMFFAVTQQRVVIPFNSQGIFSLFVPQGSIQVSASGPAAKFHILFCNMPCAPNVWKTV